MDDTIGSVVRPKHTSVEHVSVAHVSDLTCCCDGLLVILLLTYFPAY